MTPIRRATFALIAAAAMGTASLSLAQPNAGAAQDQRARPTLEQRQAHFEARHTQRMDRLKTLLQIQPEQQKAWDQYAAAMKPELPHFAKEKSAEKPTQKPEFTTLQRLDKSQAERAAAQKRDDATRVFYQALNPAQQKVFDELDRGHGKKHGKRGDKFGDKHDEKRGDKHECKHDPKPEQRENRRS